MKYLLTVTEAYRVDSEPEVKTLIDEAKENSMWKLTKYDCKYKEAKAKGETIDDWFHVTLTKVFTAEKEPERTVSIAFEED